MSENYYEILGLNRNATLLEIKKTYKNLAKKYHPDLNKDIGAKEKFLEIIEAYKNLMNPPVSKWYGLFECWDDLINYKEFNLNNTTTFLGKYIDNPNEEEEEYNFNYKNYKWTRNKIKLLYKLYEKISNEYYCEIIDDLVGIEVIINHFNKVLNKTIGIKDKITKPDDMKLKHIPVILNRFYRMEMKVNGYSKQPKYMSKYHDFRTKKIKKLIFDIQNQFHPKFINKFSWRIQLFLHNKMKELIIYFQSNNKKERVGK